MQHDNDARPNQGNEVDKIVERLFNEPSEEAFLEDSKLLGGLINAEMRQRESETTVKAPHIAGIKAAKAFEEFVKKHFKDVQSFERNLNPVFEDIGYDVILPRISFENMLVPGIMEEFAAILKEANGLDISIEKENPHMKGMIYFDISFPAVIRV